MISLSLTPSSAASLSSKPPLISLLKPLCTHHHNNNKIPNQRRIRNGKCRAEFSPDAPLAVAIGACILNSIVFPIGPDDDQRDGDSVIDSTDARFAVMGIISFIPYFNWLSWVFAFLDTGRRRYVVYSLVYLAPYLRSSVSELIGLRCHIEPLIVPWSNLSLSPEESWMPIASILFCIIHIQLEVSIKNGDFQGFQLFSEVAKSLSSVTRKKQTHSKGHEGVSEEGRRKDYVNLPSAQEQSRNEIRGWGVPQKPLEDPEHLNEDGDADDARKQ